MRVLEREQYREGLRVYVKELDVFGRLEVANWHELANSTLVDKRWKVVCEEPLLGREHQLGSSAMLVYVDL